MSKKILRTTHEQYELLVQYIESHPQLRSNKLANNFTSKDRTRLWEDLAQCLNSVRGPRKDVSKWQKTWTDFKHLTLKAARMRRRKLKSTGLFNSETFEEEMTPLQLRVLTLMGWNEDISNTEDEEENLFEEVPQSPTSMNEAFYPITEERCSSENDEPMHENAEVKENDAESNIELFSITKYSNNESSKQRKESSAIRLLLKQQSEILEKISEQHKLILDTQLKEKSKKETNKNSTTVLLEQQNKFLEKIAKQLERIANAQQLRKEENNNSINLLLEQQNLLLEKIAVQQERIADAELRKADTLPELTNTIKELLKK